MRVAEYLYQFSLYLGMEPEWCNKAYTIGTFHDIGKLKLPSTLLNKAGPLTGDEFEIIKKHTSYGAEIIQQIPGIPSDFPEIILYHHENIDGSGYHGIEGKHIPMLSRMIRIVDTYDTMLNGRVYQNPVSEKQAVEELMRFRGAIYDDELVQSFVEMLNGVNQIELISAR